MARQVRTQSVTIANGGTASGSFPVEVENIVGIHASGWTAAEMRLQLSFNSGVGWVDWYGSLAATREIVDAPITTEAFYATVSDLRNQPLTRCLARIVSSSAQGAERTLIVHIAKD